MSQEAIRRLSEVYRAFNEGGIEAILDWIGPEMEVHDRDSQPDRETYHGREEITRLFASTMEAFDKLRFEPLEFVERGDRVVVVLRQLARGRGSGIELEDEVAHAWTIRAGRPVGLHMYGDREKAMQALTP